MGRKFSQDAKTAFKLLLLFAGPLASHEMLNVTDIEKLNSNRLPSIMQEIIASSEFQMVYTEDHEVKLRDKRGNRVLSFGELSEEDIASIPNIMSEVDFKRKNKVQLLDRKEAFIYSPKKGELRGQMVYDEETGMDLYFEERDSEDLDYHIEGIESFLSFINTVTGGKLNFLNKEFKDNETLVQLFNVDESKFVSCTIKEAVYESLKMAGLSDEEIEGIIDFKGADLEAEDVENSESAGIGDISKQERVIYTIDNIDDLERDGKTNVYIVDDKLLKEASDENVLRMIEAELSVLSGFDASEVTFTKDDEGLEASEVIVNSLQRLMTSDRMPGNAIDAFFTFTLSAKEGKADKRLQRITRLTKKEVREFLEENDYDAQKRSNEDQIAYLEEIELELLDKSMNQEEEAEKAEQRLVENAASYDKRAYEIVTNQITMYRMEARRFEEKAAEIDRLISKIQLSMLYDFTNRSIREMARNEEAVSDSASENNQITLTEEDFTNGEPSEVEPSDGIPSAGDDIKVAADEIDTAVSSDIDVSLE